jgi:GWxTD domain-containing protein
MTKTLIAFGCAFLLAAQASAQTAPQTEKEKAIAAASAKSLADARALVAAGDSAAAVKLLLSAVQKDPNNGPLWFEYGSILSAQSRYAWRKVFMSGGAAQLITAAETSLARATRLSPDSADYMVAYGKHLWGTHTTDIGRASRLQQDAYAMRKADGDSVSGAVSADMLGMFMWRRFEPLIGRGTPLQIDGSMNFLSRRNLVQFIKENYRPPEKMFGLSLYEEALSYFREARTADPDVELYFRHEMMALAEYGRWNEMAAIAKRRAAERPGQPWPWLVLGLSQYHLNRKADASAALDSGFARLPDADRQRLSSISRLMPRGRDAWYDSLALPAKEQLQQLYWNTANPTMLLPGNVLHDEFRARAVFAELRFTDEDKPIPGTQTAKGEVYMRFGPPEIVMAGTIVPRHIDPAFENMTSWVYVNELMIFTFGQNRLSGTSYQTTGSRVDFDSSKIDRPVAWTNLPVLRNRVDSVSAQVARFRAAGDSVDVAIFSGIRTGSLRRNAQNPTSSIKYGVFFVDALGRELTRRAETISSSESDTLALMQRNVFMRTTARASAARVEALEPDLMQAARAITDLSGFTTAGFGISDLLIASNVTAPGSTASARWTDYKIASLTGGLVKRSEPLALLWENYEPAANGGSGKLQVSIQVQRETDRGLVAMAGRVIGGLREAVGANRGSNKVGISYVREFPASPVVVDHLMVDLGRLEPGRYRVSLTVTDAIRNVTASRMQRFTIVP